MSQHNVKLLRYGHGYFGGGVFETCVMPALSHSAFAANNFVMEEEQYMIQQVGDRGSDKHSAGGDEPLRVPQATKEGYAECPAGGAFDARYPNSAYHRGRVQEGGEITGALTTDSQWMVYEGTERVIQVGNTTPGAGITTRENPNQGRVYSPEGIGASLTTMQGGNLEPQIIEPVGCAVRARAYVGQAAQLEIGGEVANAITSVQKDSMVVEPRGIEGVLAGGEPQAMGHYRPEGRTSENVPYSEYVLRPKTDGIADTLTSMAGNRERMIAEPQIESVGNIYPSGGQGGKVVNPEGIAPAMCECHGEVTRITEGKAFSSLQEGGLDRNLTVDDPASAVCAAFGLGGGNAAMVVESPKVSCQYQGEDADKAVQAAAELGELVAGKKEGEKIAVDVTKDGTLRPHLDNGSNYGLMDYYASHTDSVAGTQIATRPQQAYGPQTRYRIRKLTPRECFRLMDVSEADIDALLDAKDARGKALLTKSALYKLAGNSIVESCLYFLFDKMFIHNAPSAPVQGSLF